MFESGKIKNENSYDLKKHLYKDHPHLAWAPGRIVSPAAIASAFSHFSASVKDTTSELASVSSDCSFLILNAKQGNCEQLLKSFGLTTRLGTRIRVYRLRLLCSWLGQGINGVASIQGYIPVLVVIGLVLTATGGSSTRRPKKFLCR